ncbi:merozoite surface protein 5 [Plasmodium malariae]|uniref:Merozoite surface protein 5 n=1 Tax=Plasmodium malariae TaxID=5858 RepID=A0A1C3KAQ2_PLAMA|nr:merozoite surface protein 5 [Plasmodium malariae]
MVTVHILSFVNLFLFYYSSYLKNYFDGSLVNLKLGNCNCLSKRFLSNEENDSNPNATDSMGNHSNDSDSLTSSNTKHEDGGDHTSSEAEKDEASKQDSKVNGENKHTVNEQSQNDLDSEEGHIKTLDNKDSNDKKMESRKSEAEISEHKHKPSDDSESDKKESSKGNHPQDSSDDKSSEEGVDKNTMEEQHEKKNINPTDGDGGDNTLYLDNIDDQVAHYSALKNNRIEKGVTDNMVLSDIVSGNNTKSCAVNNGGCGDDQLCIRIDNIGIKCICKEGHLFGNKCILTKSLAQMPLFTLAVSIFLCSFLIL